MTNFLDMSCKVSTRAAASRVGKETILLHLDTGTYFGLDELGSAIWRKLQDGQSPREICASIAESYGEPIERVEEDARAFLAKLSEHDLLECE